MWSIRAHPRHRTSTRQGALPRAQHQQNGRWSPTRYDLPASVSVGWARCRARRRGPAPTCHYRVILRHRLPSEDAPPKPITTLEHDASNRGMRYQLVSDARDVQRVSLGSRAWRSGAAGISVETWSARITGRLPLVRSRAVWHMIFISEILPVEHNGYRRPREGGLPLRPKMRTADLLERDER